MLTVRAGSKKRFFMRRDVRLIRRRTFKRPRAGTRAHVLHERAKKILSNETKNSSRSFYLRVVRVPFICRHTNEREFYFLDLRFISSFLFPEGVWVIGFSLAVMQSSRRFEILCSFSFFGVRVFLVSNARERFTHQKKTEEEKKTDCYPKHFFCLS